MKVVRKIYADEPKPVRADSFQFIMEKNPEEEEDPSSIILNEINASKYEVINRR